MRKVHQDNWFLPASWIALFILLVSLLFVRCANAKQMQPDPKRVHQIQVAMDEHGYILPPHATWSQTQAILKKIAQDRGWQTHHVPDARVLILLGLGNQYSNPAVSDEGPNHLDGGK